MQPAVPTHDGLRLGQIVVQALDGMVQLRNAEDPEVRFLWTKRQAADFALLIRPEAPQLAAAISAAAEGSSRLAAVARSYIPLDS
jgi:hypothetical protein